MSLNKYISSMLGDTEKLHYIICYMFLSIYTLYCIFVNTVWKYIKIFYLDTIVMHFVFWLLGIYEH